MRFTTSLKVYETYFHIFESKASCFTLSFPLLLSERLGEEGVTTGTSSLITEMTDIYWEQYVFFWAKTNMDNRKVYYMNLRSSLVIQEDQDLVLKMDTCNFRWTSIINSHIIYRRVIDDFFFWKYLKTEFKPHIYMKRWFRESLSQGYSTVRNKSKCFLKWPQHWT